MNNLNRFSVNGKSYTAEDVDFMFMAYLDKFGISPENIGGPAALNCYFAYCSGLDEKTAAKEINTHVINNGGKMPEELSTVYAKMIEESGFFRAIMGATEQESQTEESETSAETPKKKTTRRTATE